MMCVRGVRCVQVCRVVRVEYVICVGVCVEHVCLYRMCVVCSVGEW